MSSEQDKIKHGKRLQRAWNTIKKQLKIAKAYGLRRPIAQPHRLVKHHAMDCGQPGCNMCSSPRKNGYVKGDEKLTIQERRAKQKERDE